MFALLVHLVRRTTLMMTRLPTTHNATQSSAPLTKKWSAMFAQLVLLERRMLLEVTTHQETTRSVL
jgi:hypothetical protein